MDNAGELSRKYRILVVDDDETVADLVVRLLQEKGFHAWSVYDPTEAPQRAAEIRPDLVIVDFNMPKLIGPELAILLKSRAETAKAPILFLSGMIDEDHREIGKYSGGAAYLEKPVDPEKLISTIRGLLKL